MDPFGWFAEVYPQGVQAEQIGDAGGDPISSIVLERAPGQRRPQKFLGWKE